MLNEFECFLIEPTRNVRSYARVVCAQDHANVFLEREGISGDSEDDFDVVKIDWGAIDWPRFCIECGREMNFDDPDSDDFRSSGSRRQWIRKETGERYWDLREFGPGAMWNAYWMPSSWKHNGECITVMLPNNLEWNIDSQASNCTRPGEDHDCWCRHGKPPNLTVDKNPEPGRSTCAAGAGSIASGSGDRYWHGFLRDGKLVPC